VARRTKDEGNPGMNGGGEDVENGRETGGSDAAAWAIMITSPVS
jgi:hypothetical protein